MPYTEDTLVQQTTAEYLEQQLGWESVYVYNNEDFGPTLWGSSRCWAIFSMLQAAFARCNR